MLAVLRIILATVFIIFTTLCAFVYCLFSPKNPKHVYVFCRWFNQLQKIVGVKLVQRGLDNAPTSEKSVYISNHQSILDFVTDPGMLRPRTVSLGKRDLLYVPFFGLLYWITGNIMINREDNPKHAIPSNKWRKLFISEICLFGFTLKERAVKGVDYCHSKRALFEWRLKLACLSPRCVPAPRTIRLTSTELIMAL